jgi:hypothetical protein
VFLYSKGLLAVVALAPSKSAIVATLLIDNIFLLSPKINWEHEEAKFSGSSGSGSGSCDTVAWSRSTIDPCKTWPKL